MSSPKARPEVAKLLDGVLHASGDVFVEAIDDLLQLLALVRDEAVEMRTERAMLAEHSMLTNTVSVDVERAVAGQKSRRDHVADADRLEELQRAVLRRRELGDLVTRVNDGLRGRPPTEPELREMLVVELRRWSERLWLLHPVQDADANAQEIAREFIASVFTFWPSKAERLEPLVAEVAAAMLATRSGRRKNGCGLGAEELRSNLLRKIGIAVGSGTLSTARYRARKKALSRKTG